jgi:hypothetical protein
MDGLRTRYIVMDRLHVTRSYAAPFKPARHCTPHPPSTQTGVSDLLKIFSNHRLPLN